MNKIKSLFLALTSALFISGILVTNTLAAGPHEGVACLGCHSVHFAVDDKAFAVKNTTMINPINGESLDGLVAAKCLGCHETQELGGAGIRPIHLHTTHPIGIIPNPRVADVPDNLLKDGKLDCISCHEPHPSNPNFMYLRVDTGSYGENLQKFCVTCHSAKADMKLIGVESVDSLELFSAMDQQAGAKNFRRDEVVTNNPSVEYIKPLGVIPANDILPNYLKKPAWVNEPEFNPLAQ